MTENKKVLVFFIPTLEGGGAERNVVNFSVGLKDYYNVKIILCERRGAFLNKIPREVEIISLETSRPFFVFLKIRKYFLNNHIDIFISTFVRFNFINLLAKWFSRKDFKFVTIEQTPVSILYTTTKSLFRKFIGYFFLSYLMKFFYTKVDAIVCVSNGVKEDLLKFVSNSLKISVIYNPIIEEKIRYLSNEEVNHLWLQDKENFVILTVGRLVEAKDYQTMILAFGLVLKKNKAKLLILGEGPEKQRLQKLIKELRIEKDVDFLGFQENPYKYMAKAKVFVSSSRREGFSNSIVEAMACGLPVISTDTVGPKEIIDNNKNGILVPIKDYKALSEAILKIFSDPSLANFFSRQGKKRAEYFTIKKSIDQYEKIFQSLLVECKK